MVIRSNNRSVGQASQERSFIEIARRNQIVECAIDVIAELGYGQASLAQIAKRAGISKGIISYHFADKNELIRELVRTVLTGFEGFVKPRVEAADTAAAMLRGFIESNIQYMGIQRKHLLVLVDIFANARGDDGEHCVDMSWYEASLTLLEQMLRHGQAAGEFRAFSPRVMAISLRAAIDATPAQIAANPELDLETWGRELANLFDRATRASD